VGKKTDRDRRSGGRYADATKKEADRDVPIKRGRVDSRRPASDAARGRTSTTGAPAKPERPKVLVLGPTVTVRDMSQMMDISPIDIIKELMNNGIMANINQLIDFDTATIIAEELGFKVTEEKAPEVVEKEPEVAKTLRQIICETADPAQLEPRPPVVTVLGHVDHGKTTLLDAIRQTQVVETEAGGITQRIGAYQVEIGGRKISFLDTPGHEAFTAMRARGAQVTDLAVLVVAADDGVMPQTREAIDHARAAQVPIMVALNKIDKANANPDRLKQQLADLGLVVEDWGGDVICVPVSAKLRQGIEDLLENVLLVTDVAELKANPNCPALGTVVEGKLDKSRGVVATLLVQNGTLRKGDVIGVGAAWGRVRAMFNDKGDPVDEAPPSMPVAIMGLSDVPVAGDVFHVYESERDARSVVAESAAAARAAASRPAPKALSLEDIVSQIKAGHAKELNIVLKADVQGSIEPIINSLEQLGNEALRVRVLHQGTGNISESDIMLATASQAIVVGFAVGPDNAALRLAEQEGVDIRLYDIIYLLLEDLDKALRGLRDPEFRDVVTGHAEVRAVFHIAKLGKVAGCYVKDGTVARDARVRVLRKGEQVFAGSLHSLKRFEEDVKEVATGYECGIAITGYDDLQEGDILEFYKSEQVPLQ
jgi:translation initiation factor IF-2